MAMALISASEKPLAMRSITVDGRWPDLNASIAATMSPGLRSMSRGTVVSTDWAAGWQPEQDMAPGGASAGPAARAGPINPKTSAAAVTMRVAFMSEPPEYHLAPFGRVRPFLCVFLCVPQIVVFERQR